MDEEMANLYKDGLEYLETEPLKESQRAWVKERKKCVDNIQCLKFAYQNRIRDINDELQVAYGSVTADDYAEAEEEDIAPETTVQKPAENTYANAEERQILENVKVSYFTNYPNITIGQAFERFDNPKWTVSRTPDRGYNLEFTGNTSKDINSRFWHYGTQGRYRNAPKELSQVPAQYRHEMFIIGEPVFITLYVPENLSDIRTNRMYSKSWYKEKLRHSDIYPVIFHDF